MIVLFIYATLLARARIQAFKERNTPTLLH